MKLFVRNKKNLQERIYLTTSANTRNELAFKINSLYFQVDGMYYTVNDVFAEPTGGDTLFGAITGGLLGAITGGAGIVVGALGGALLGSGRDNSEKQKVDVFNSSYANI